MQKVGKLTEHFTFEELVKSPTALAKGISNLPASENIRLNLAFTAAGLERIRAFLDGRPIKINSGYRCPELNEAVGGSKESRHMQGLAVDFTCPSFGPPAKVAAALKDSLPVLGIDQLILEGSWIHVSFSLTPRYELLTKIPGGGYRKGVA